MSKTNFKPGEGLQILVHALERAIHGSPNIEIESPKHLPDKDTGKPREHDVVLTFKLAHHSLVTALECRDRTRKVGVPDVEQFAKKCERTGIHRGIVISSTGFAKSALRKAASLDIGCLSLEEATRFNWCRAPGVEVTTCELLPGPSWQVEPAVPFEGVLQLYDAQGPIDARRAANIAHAFLNQRPRELAVQQDAAASMAPVLHRFVVNECPSLYLIDSAGNRVPLKRIIVPVRFRTRKELVPFNFRQYVDVAKGTGLTNVAFAPLDLGGVKGNIVLHEEEKGVRVSFVPLPTKKGRSKKKPPRMRKPN